MTLKTSPHFVDLKPPASAAEPAADAARDRRLFRSWQKRVARALDRMPAAERAGLRRGLGALLSRIANARAAKGERIQ